MRLLAQTRNLEIPGSRFARPGMTVDWHQLSRLLKRRALLYRARNE